MIRESYTNDKRFDYEDDEKSLPGHRKITWIPGETANAKIENKIQANENLSAPVHTRSENSHTLLFPNGFNQDAEKQSRYAKPMIFGGYSILNTRYPEEKPKQLDALYIEGEKMQFDFTKEKTRGDSLTEKPASVRISESSNQEFDANCEQGGVGLRGRLDIIEGTNFESFGPTEQHLPQFGHHEENLVSADNAMFGPVHELPIQEEDKTQDEEQIKADTKEEVQVEAKEEMQAEVTQDNQEILEDAAEERIQKTQKDDVIMEVKPKPEQQSKESAKDIFDDLNSRLDRINDLDRDFEERQKSLNERLRKIQQGFQSRATSNISTPANPRSTTNLGLGTSSTPRRPRETAASQVKEVRKIEPHELLKLQGYRTNELISDSEVDSSFLKNSGFLSSSTRTDLPESQKRLVLDPQKSPQPSRLLASSHIEQQSSSGTKPQIQSSRRFENSEIVKEHSPTFLAFDEGEPHLPERKDPEATKPKRLTEYMPTVESKIIFNNNQARNENQAKEVYQPKEVYQAREVVQSREVTQPREENQRQQQQPSRQDNMRIEEEYVISSSRDEFVAQEELTTKEKSKQPREKEKSSVLQQQESEEDSDDSVEIYDINFRKLKPNIMVQDVGFQQANSQLGKSSSSGRGTLKPKLSSSVSQSQNQIRVIPKKELSKSTMFYSPNNSKAQIWEDERKSFNDAMLLRERQTETYQDSKIPQKSPQKLIESQKKPPLYTPSREKLKSSENSRLVIHEEWHSSSHDDENNEYDTFEEPRIVSRKPNANSQTQQKSSQPSNKEAFKSSENHSSSIRKNSVDDQKSDEDVVEEEIIYRKQSDNHQSQKQSGSKQQSLARSEPKSNKQSPNKTNPKSQQQSQPTSQQPLQSQTFGQAPYGNPYQPGVGAGFPHPMSPVVNPYPHLAGTPGFFGQPVPIQTFPVYSPEAFVNKWILREEASSKKNEPTHSTPIIINNNIISPDKGVDYQGTKQPQQIDKKPEKSKEIVLTDYLKEQEDFLKQLNKDKKLKREKIEREKAEALSQSRQDTYSETSKTHLNEHQQRSRVRDLSIDEELDEGEPRLNTSSQLKRSSPQNKWAMRQASDIEDSYSPNRSQTQEYPHHQEYPRGEAFEVVWSQDSQSEEIQRRKRELEERLEHQKYFSSKNNRNPEKSKEELIQLRKQMRKYRGNGFSQDSNGSRSFTPVAGSENTSFTGGASRSRSPQPLAFEVMGYKRGKSREPDPELIDRLAAGKRAKVTKEEMYQLTRKNYALLPEVQAKKQMNRKKEEERMRKERMRNADQKYREVGYQHRQYYQPYQ